MKIVDKNYSYDELEGFEVFRPEQKGMRQELVQMSFHGRTVTFTKAAIEILDNPEYITCRINEGRKLLLIEKSDSSDENALLMRVRQNQNRIKNKTECTALMRVIEKLISRDLKTVNVTFDGTKSRKIRNAIIFDLNKVKAKKKIDNFGKKAAA